MNRRVAGLALPLLLRAAAVLGQTRTSMLSKDEISELLSKADEKVAQFQVVVRLVKPDLDNANPRFSKEYLNAASTAREMIRAIQKKGVSAYRLVGLLATLDDLSMHAA